MCGNRNIRQKRGAEVGAALQLLEFFPFCYHLYVLPLSQTLAEPSSCGATKKDVMMEKTADSTVHWKIGEA